MQEFEVRRHDETSSFVRGGHSDASAAVVGCQESTYRGSSVDDKLIEFFPYRVTVDVGWSMDSLHTWNFDGFAGLFLNVTETQK